MPPTASSSTYTAIPRPIRARNDALSRASSASSSESTAGLVTQSRAGLAMTRSPISRAPLLSDAQTPGMSERYSAGSFASLDQSPSTRSTAGLISSSSRFGPTANISPTPTGSDLKLRNGGLGGAAIPVDDEDIDDALHTFTAKEKQDLSTPFDITSWRGWANAMTLMVLLAAVVILFAGYPIIDFYYGDRSSSGSSTAGYNLGGINSTGQYPAISGLATLIDSDTPSDKYTYSGADGKTWNLVFSDEFNTDGRTFYDGDDPFFQAVDIHYWPTGDFEWYDPSAVTTKDGNLVITMTQEPIHDLNFKSGMVQSWNKLCFNKNMYVEVSVSLPGVSSIGGFWPGVWLMGNLGRPGYGASTDGMWPYSYDSCDVGILPNQTYVNGTGPDATLTTGANGGPLSYLPGMRTPACTCPGEVHPGPNNNVGRAAPEIDILEAQIVIDEGHGEVSQSFQIAPYDDYYQFDNTTSGTYEQYDTSITYFNTYLGGYYQQAVSSLTAVDNDIYYDQNGPNTGVFKMFGVEIMSNSADRAKGYVTWYSQGKKSWTMSGSAVGPNSKTEVSQRLVTEEPMALIFNLGASNNFQNVDFSHMTFPNYFLIDYVRVYQNDEGTIGCDPDDHPTAEYIATYADVYNNPNLTTWEGAGYTFPKNTLSGC